MSNTEGGKNRNPPKKQMNSAKKPSELSDSKQGRFTTSLPLKHNLLCFYAKTY